MRSLFVLFVFGLIRHSFAAMHDNVASPFGLTFSRTTINASRTNASGAIKIKTYPVTTEYTAYYHNAVSRLPSSMSWDKESQAAVASMLLYAVTPITEHLTKYLGHEPEYVNLYLPSLFASGEAGVLAKILLFDKVHAFHYGSSEHAILYPYKFLDCQSLGRGPNECKNDDTESDILVME